MGCHLGVTGRTGGGSDNRENVYKAACISKTRHLTSFLKSTLMSLVFYETHPQMKVLIIILEYTISKCVKLLDCLSDPHKPLINRISSGSSPAASSGPVDNCFICVHVHGFPICVPSFCKKGKTLKTKHWLLQKPRQK